MIRDKRLGVIIERKRKKKRHIKKSFTNKDGKLDETMI